MRPERDTIYNNVMEAPHGMVEPGMVEPGMAVHVHVYMYEHAYL